MLELLVQGGRSVNPSRNEHTIAVSCEVSGRGYWSGKEVRVIVHPAALGTGVRLIRSDLPAIPVCEALVSRRYDASLRTNLANGEAKFQMVEHLMAALYALEIDNCICEIDAEELPSLDGSSFEFVEQLGSAGLIVQAATPIAPQAFGVELSPDRFIREVASARTFVTKVQADQIRESGLASHVTNQDLLVIGPDGPVDNKYRFRNECARHKTLDLIGDLSLAGVDLIGRFTSFRGGHNLNGQMASQLAELAAQEEHDTQSAFLNQRKAA